MNLLHRKKEQPISRMLLLLVTGLVLGFLVTTQAKYFTDYVSTVSRDSTENVFRRIQILKKTNDELNNEIALLEKQLEDLNNQAQSFQTIANNIKKNEIIAGEIDIWGPGIELIIETKLNTIWFTDITNALFASGAEAISINNIRLTDTAIGFDKLPNGQIMINGVILQKPYTIKVIGDKESLQQVLKSPFGILQRMESTLEEFSYSLNEKDRIEMKEV